MGQCVSDKSLYFGILYLAYIYIFFYFLLLFWGLWFKIGMRYWVNSYCYLTTVAL